MPGAWRQPSHMLRRCCGVTVQGRVAASDRQSELPRRDTTTSTRTYRRCLPLFTKVENYRMALRAQKEMLMFCPLYDCILRFLCHDCTEGCHRCSTATSRTTGHTAGKWEPFMCCSSGQASYSCFTSMDHFQLAVLLHF